MGNKFYSNEALLRLASYGKGGDKGGSIDLWFPFVHLGTDVSIAGPIANLYENRLTSVDQELFFTFLHEYVHLVQVVLFPLCQLPFDLTCCYIYDIFNTAATRREQKRAVLHPIEHGIAFRQTKELLLDVYNHKTVILLDGESAEFKLIHLLEGSVQIIEEAYRKRRISRDTTYTMMRRINVSILGSRALSDRELLDVCEIALKTRNPDAAYLEMLKGVRSAINHNGFWTFQELGKLANDIGLEEWGVDPDFILEEMSRTLTNDIFKAHVEQMSKMFRGVREYFARRPTLSTLYESVKFDDAKGLPKIVVLLIALYGTPIIEYENGRLELFDVDVKCGKRVIDQNIVGIKSVVDAVSCVGSSRCHYFEACKNAAQQGVSNVPEVTDVCLRSPWNKDNGSANLCPFTAIWKAFGLEGLTKGAAVKNDLSDGLENRPLLELKFDTIFGCEVRVWSDDNGNEPHFHIKTVTEKRGKKKIDCCVKIEAAEYFKHGQHQDELNHAQRKELVELLSKTDHKYVEEGETVWVAIRKWWNNKYPNRKVSESVLQPDYTLLPCMS